MKIFVQDDNGQKVRVYPVAEAAQKLGYTPRHTRELASEGKIPGWKVAGTWFIRLQAVDTR
jgi:excisionase family DNA binding protein